MTIKIVKVLVATVALGALVLGTDPSMAKGGGGGHGVRRWRSWRSSRWRTRRPLGRRAYARVACPRFKQSW